jgi:hypothetical protein
VRLFVCLSLKSSSSFYRQRVIELLKKLFIRMRVARHHAAALAAKARRRPAASPHKGEGSAKTGPGGDVGSGDAAAAAEKAAATCDAFVAWLGEMVRDEPVRQRG